MAEHELCALSRPLLRALLRSRAHTVPHGGLDASRVDWDAVGQDADRHGAGVLAGIRLRELGLDRILPASLADRWAADIRHARLQHALQSRLAATVTRQLTRQGVPHVWIKGLAYRLLYYRPQWARLAGDVDLLVRRGDVERTRATLRHAGLVQACCSPDCQDYRPATRSEIAAAESNHYELVQFVRTFRLHGGNEWLLRPPFIQRPPFAYETGPAGTTLRCHVDVHWALHFLFAEADPMRAPRWTHGPDGTRLPLLNLEWSLVFSAFKLYYEAFLRPNYGFIHLVDLVALARDSPDWSAVAALVDEFWLDAALYYAMAAAETLAGGPLVPAGLMDNWRRGTPKQGATRPSLDQGDFVPYLLGRRVSGDFLARAHS